MNTQRPEWNDANNALVGNGVSMVTLYYLRRFFKFFEDVLDDTSIKEVAVSNEILDFFNTVFNTFESHQSLLSGSINDIDRRTILDNLGEAGSLYRETVYQYSFSGDKTQLSTEALKKYVSISNEYLEHSIKANKSGRFMINRIQLNFRCLKHNFHGH